MGYRYAFNGKELDPLGMGGGGSTYDYGFRIYNAQIARFLSVDPLFKSFPWNSVYSFAENDVIRSIDLDGLEKRIYNYVADDQGKVKLQLSTFMFVNKNMQEINGPIGNGTLTFLHYPNTQTSSGYYTFLENNSIFTMKIGEYNWENDGKNRNVKTWLQKIDEFTQGAYDGQKSRNATAFEDWVIRNCDQEIVNDFIQVFQDSRGTDANRGGENVVVPKSPDYSDDGSDVPSPTNTDTSKPFKETTRSFGKDSMDIIYNYDDGDSSVFRYKKDKNNNPTSGGRIVHSRKY